MNIRDSPIIKIISAQVNLVVKFFDNAYKQGWLLYLIFGLIGFAILVIFFS